MLSIEKTWLFIIGFDLDGSRPPRGSRSGWRLARAAKSLQRQPELRPRRAGIFPKRAHVNVALAVGTAIAAPAHAEPVPAPSPPGPPVIDKPPRDPGLEREGE